MALCSYSKEFTATSYTNIENVFIYEYMPQSDNDAVKVYIYGLFLCQNADFDMSLSSFANSLKMTEGKVIDSFKYWEDLGLLTIVSENPFSVKYYPIRGSEGKPKKYTKEKYSSFASAVQALIESRMISTNEYSEYFSVMDTFGIQQEAMLMIVKYCIDLKGSSVGYKYIIAVARDFGKRGIVTVEHVENELKNYIQRTNEIEKILKAMSLSRKPEIDDLNYLIKWTKELGFDVESVVFAAKSLKKSTFKKLDQLLTELYSNKCFSIKEIEGFSAKKQYLYELAVKINRQLSVYMDVIDPVVENYTSKWDSFGYTEDELLFIAKICFKHGENTLEYMDDTVNSLYKEGIISMESISFYFSEITRSNDLIKQILALTGIRRRPNAWDRENLKLWRSWNFSDEMILEAAKLSQGKSSPIAYVNAILGNWKRKEVFTKELIPTAEYREKKYTDKELSGMIDKLYNAETKAENNLAVALENERFKEIYNRLSALEHDIGMAIFYGKKEEQASLEAERDELIIEEEKILGEMGLSISDLSPKY